MCDLIKVPNWFCATKAGHGIGTWMLASVWHHITSASHDMTSISIEHVTWHDINITSAHLLNIDDLVTSCQGLFGQ